MPKNITEGCNYYNFDTDNSYCDVNDVKISFNIYLKTTSPKAGKHFTEVRSTSEDLKRKCETLFRQIFYLIDTG